MPRITITVPDKNAQPYRFQLDRQTVTLGRGSDNDIVIESGSVSVQHAEMRRLQGGYELHDVGSTNGIKLDEIRYEIIPLLNGAAVKIGDVSFDFELSEEETEALSHESSPELTPELPPESPPEPSPITQKIQLPKKGPATPLAEPAPPVLPAAPTYAPAASGDSGFAAILVMLILASGAFFAGLAIRHQKETGGSLIQAIQSKNAEKKPPAVQAPRQ